MWSNTYWRVIVRTFIVDETLTPSFSPPAALSLSGRQLQCSVFGLVRCLGSAMCVGVCNKKLHRYEDALEAFNKLHSILRNSAQVMYQLADLYPCHTQTTDAQIDRQTWPDILKTS